MQNNRKQQFFLGLFLAAMLVVGFAAPNSSVLAAEDAIAAADRFTSWNITGPVGGDVRSMVVDPKDKNHFYFGTLDGQVYSSNDAGTTWQLVANFNNGRSQLILDSMMIDPRDSKTLYIGAHRHKEPGGFYKTTDGGATWRESKDLKNEAIYALTQSAQNPDMIFAGTYTGVWQSTDSGNNWTKMPNGGVEGLINVESLAVDPRNSDVIYAGTWYLPYKTSDGGKSWKVVKTGMIDDSDVFAIDLDPRNPDHVFASACSGIYESQNNGENWKKVQGIPSQSRRTRAILQHPSKPGYVYAGTTEGFWMTADGGKSWAITTTRQLEINTIAVHPEDPNRVYIGTNNYGVMVSNDAGRTFTMTNRGFSTRLTNSIVVDNEMPNRLYATTINTATGGGFFFTSSDGGATWQPSMKNFSSRLIGYSVLQDEANPNTIYLATNLGIYRSLDRGASWSAVMAPKPKKVAPARRPVKKPAAAAPSANPRTATKPAAKKPAAVVTTNEEVQPSKIVITVPDLAPTARVAAIEEKVNALIPTNDGKNGMFAATNNGLYRTYDIDKGWDRLYYGVGLDKQTLTVAVSAQEPKRILVGTAKSGLLESRDGGATWKQETKIPLLYPIAHIEIDPTRSAHIYVGTKQTLYMTKDGGTNWERRGGGLPVGDYETIIVNPNNPNEIFAGSVLENRGGLYHSMNGGSSWERIDDNNKTLPSRRVWSLAFDPRNANRLFVGSHSAGVYVVERGAVTAVNQ